MPRTGPGSRDGLREKGLSRLSIIEHMLPSPPWMAVLSWTGGEDEERCENTLLFFFGGGDGGGGG